MLKHLPLGFGAIGFKNLLEVRHYAVAGDTCITKDCVIWLLLCNFCHHIIRDMVVKAGDEVAISPVILGVCLCFSQLDFATKQDSQVEHDLE